MYISPMNSTFLIRFTVINSTAERLINKMSPPMPRVSLSERRSEKSFFFLNSRRAEFLKLRVHFWLLFLSMFEFYPASIRNGK